MSGHELAAVRAPKPWVRNIARRYTRYRMRGAFDGVYVAGIESLKDAASQGPLLIAANHVAWWDAFLVVLIDELLETDGYCLMDADNLRTLPFFRWFGAIALDRSTPRASLRDLQRAATLLDRPGRALWIFPQGEQRPAHLRPLGLSSGVHMLARRTGASVVTASVQYQFRETSQPSALISLRPAARIERSRRSVFMQELETQMVAGLDHVDRFLLGDGEQFEEVIAPRGKRRVPVGGRLLASCANDKGMEHG